MKRTVYLTVVPVLVLSMAACSREASTTSADSIYKPATAAALVVDKIKPEPRITIPAGTRLRVALIDAIRSDKNRPGDQFLASLAEPIIIDGKTVLEKGTKVRGRVIDAKESGRVKGRASVELILTEIDRANGRSVSISTKPYTAVAQSTVKRDVGIIAGGAGIGAAIGAIAGGGKGAAIGAAVGGGAGTGTVLAAKGKEIQYAPETRLQFTLASPVEV